MNRRITAVLTAVTFLLIPLTAGASQTTTTTSVVDTTTTVVDDTTTTTVADTTTTTVADSTTTSVEEDETTTTSQDDPDIDGPGAWRFVSWSAGGDCDSITANFVGRIEQVEVSADGSPFGVIPDRGTISVPTEFAEYTLVAVPQEGYIPSPASITLTAGGCVSESPGGEASEPPAEDLSPQPSLVSDEPGAAAESDEELPFTGPPPAELLLGTAIAVLLAGIGLVLRTRSDR